MLGRLEQGHQPVPSIVQLRQLATLAPNLKPLFIDINRQENEAWPPEELAFLATSLSHLEHLAICLEITSECQRDNLGRGAWGCEPACMGMDELAHPLVNKAEAASPRCGSMIKMSMTGVYTSIME